VPSLPDSLAGKIHLLQLRAHFFGDSVGFRSIRFAEGIGGSEAFAKGSRPWLGQLNAFHNFRDGDNQVSLGGEEFQEVVCLFVSDKENLPAKVLLKSAEEGI
jgi:hypothetical protein